jgi:hypothetical protein
MFMDHESLKLEPKEKRLNITVNVFENDRKDHQKYHQLLLVLNRPIEEAMVLVKVHVNELICRKVSRKR